MWKENKSFLCGLLFALIILMIVGWSELVRSQEKYPTKAIDWITPFGPGGGSDLAARILAGHLRNMWKVPVNVINKPGGNSVPACVEVYAAAPNGYTMLIESTPSSTYLPFVVKNLPFKVMDRTFVAIATSSPQILGVPYGSPLSSIKDVEAEAKKDPGEFTWTSLGGAGGMDINSRLFFKAIGVEISKTRPVVSQGGGQAAILVAGGNVKMGFNTVAGYLPAISGKLVRPFAITGRTRYPGLSDLPTTAEVGYPTVNYEYWVGVAGPPNLPSYVLDKWNAALKEILKDPEIVSKLKNIGAIPFYLNAHDTKEFVAKEAEEGGQLYGLK
jgi:tripartite-type tricarboxylate transporter receptor subunit TctC